MDDLVKFWVSWMAELRKFNIYRLDFSRDK